MNKKIAVAIVHGMGDHSYDYASHFITLIRKEFNKLLKKEGIKLDKCPLIIEPIFWSPIVQKLEEKLWTTVHSDALNWVKLRQFVVKYLGDAIAYQPLPADTSENNLYKEIHREFEKTLEKLSIHAGHKAPLTVIAHSLGTIISSNVLYDLQIKKENSSFLSKNKSPLERGDTLTSFFTLGSPLALWHMRYPDFGVPIQVPSPNQRKYIDVTGEWINFYSKADVLSYPLKELNSHYNNQVHEDIRAKCGNIFIRNTPLSHMYYWQDKMVIRTIAKSLFGTWKSLNAHD